MKPHISVFWSQIDVDTPNTVYLHARCPGGGPVAQLCLDVDDGAGWVRSLFVQPAHQGKGLGRLLLARAFAVCQARGLQSVGLTVHENNARAHALYQRAGFVRYLDAHEKYQQFIKILSPPLCAP